MEIVVILVSTSVAFSVGFLLLWRLLSASSVSEVMFNMIEKTVNNSEQLTCVSCGTNNRWNIIAINGQDVEFGIPEGVSLGSTSASDTSITLRCENCGHTHTTNKDDNAATATAVQQVQYAPAVERAGEARKRSNRRVLIAAFVIIDVVILIFVMVFIGLSLDTTANFDWPADRPALVGDTITNQVVVLYDEHCSHCETLGDDLPALLDSYGERLSVVYIDADANADFVESRFILHDDEYPAFYVLDASGQTIGVLTGNPTINGITLFLDEYAE